MKKHYPVGLAVTKQAELLLLLQRGKANARLLTRVRILLKVDEDWKQEGLVSNSSNFACS